MWRKLGRAISHRLVTNRRLALMVDHRLQKISRPATPGGLPNCDAQGAPLRELRALYLSVKGLGQELAQSRQALIESIPAPAPEPHALMSKPCTQEDIQSAWLLHWCDVLGHRRGFHRQVWEAGYVMQALYEAGVLRRDVKIADFGGMDEICAHMVAMNCQVVTRASDAEWSSDSSRDHHGAWSRSTLNRCRSIDEAKAFLILSAKTLRPGGVAVHVFDFNLDPTGPTFLREQVIPQKHHIESFHDVLTSEGYTVAPLSFNYGQGPLDRFIDVTPFEADSPFSWAGIEHAAQLKVSVNGLLVTSFGLVIRKPT